MKMVRWLAVVLIAALLVMGSVTGSRVSAQDATPAGDCAVTSPDENVAIVTAYITAFEAQDDAAIDAALHDDYSDNVARYTAPIDSTSNSDEIGLAHMLEQFYPGSAYAIVDIFGADDQVAVTVMFTVTGHALTGELVALDPPLEVEGISIFTIECGAIASGFGVSNELELLTGVGAIPPLVMADEAAAATDNSPNPDQCTLNARTLEEVQAIAGEPAPAGAGEATAAALESVPVMVELPAGDPADDATAAGVLATTTQVFACYNAGNYLAGFAGVSERFLQSQVGVALFDEDFVAAMSAEPVALEEAMQTQLLDIRNVIVLEDGRVAALIDYHSPTPQDEGINGVETDLFIFINVDGAWLLDESIENLEAQHGPEGVSTPTS